MRRDFKDPEHPAAKILFWLAVGGVSLAYSFLWRCLNLDFLPIAGPGADSLLDSLLAGMGFAICILSIEEDAPEINERSEAFRYFFLRVGRYFLSSAIGIPLGRIVFSLVPPWSSSVGAIIGAIVAALFARWSLKGNEKDRFSFNRGTALLTEKEAMEQIGKLPSGAEPRIRWAGCDLPGEVSEGNFLCAGAIGTGKTRSHRELLRSIIPHITPGSDRRVLIYDVKSDLLGELSTMNPGTEVIVFNPFDKRSVAWDIAADVTSPSQARHFAEALIPPATTNENAFFINAARVIVAGIIDSFNQKHPGKWDLRQLIRVTATRERMERALGETDLVARYFTPPTTFDNIRNTIANVMVELEPVAALWKQKNVKRSLREWVEKGDSILVLGGKEDLQSSLQPINRVAFKMITTAFLSSHESPKRSRLWFFCDELKMAGRLDALQLLMNARSKGVRCVLGFQDLEGLIEEYKSPEAAKEILSRCSTVSWYKLNSPDTAEWASKRSGEVERFEYMDTRTQGNTSVGESLAKREAILPAEFQNLPDYKDGNVTGYHRIKGVVGVFQKTTHYEHVKTTVADFDPCPTADQYLAPWGADDDIWLGGGGDSSQQPPKKPKPSNPGPSSGIGRIDFD